MNIISTLTLRHIKTHKKRSILTILAIIVSVAMVTAVFTSSISFIKYFQNVALAIDGNWHGQFYDTDYLLHKPIFSTDENIEEFSARAYLGSATQDKDSNEFANGVFCAEKNWFAMRNVTVHEGRLPESSNEVVLTRDYVKNSEKPIEVGDTITVYILQTNGEETVKDLTVVGITDSKVSATDYNPILCGIDNEVVALAKDTLVLVRYDKLDNGIWNKLEATSKSTGIEDYSHNIELFIYFGLMRDNAMLVSLGTFVGILLLIIAVVSIFMIYDSFAVSYQERARYLGMLASVGATKRQKRFSIYFEGLILGLIGIPLGIISGIGGIAVTFKCIEGVFMDTLSVEYDGTLKVYVNFFVILGSVLASAITIFISSYIPARKASKTTAIEAIKQNGTVKVKKPKKLRTSRLTTKIFGYEGALAVKNFKRNGRRSRNIVFSLFLSVVVFLTVTNFSAMFSDTLNASFDETADGTVEVSYNNWEELEKAVKSNKDVDRYYLTAGEFSKLPHSVFKEGEENDLLLGTSNAMILFLDNISFDGYLKQLGEDTEKYHNKNNPTAIVQNVSFKSAGNKKTSDEPLKNIEGRTVTAGLEVFQDNQGISTYKDVTFTVGKQTAKLWSETTFGYQYTKWPIIILSMDFAEEFLQNDVSSNLSVVASIFSKDAETATKDIAQELKIQNIVADYSESSSSLNSVNNILKIARVFIYGFITLITIISIMNIINTISNSMNERRREFAMIRSVGMTPKSFKKMIYLEALRYGAKSLVFSLPVSAVIHFGMYKALAESFDYGFTLSVIPYIVSVAAVFAIIGIALLYSFDKIRDDNIIETLKSDID